MLYNEMLYNVHNEASKTEGDEIEDFKPTKGPFEEPQALYMKKQRLPLR